MGFFEVTAAQHNFPRCRWLHLLIPGALAPVGARRPSQLNRVSHLDLLSYIIDLLPPSIPSLNLRAGRRNASNSPPPPRPPPPGADSIQAAIYVDLW